MYIVDADSAVESVSVENYPNCVVTIRLRRTPQMPADEIVALLRAVPNVGKVRERRLGGYWVDPKMDITDGEFADMAHALGDVAKRIT